METIVAISSPGGVSTRGVLRLSGPNAVPIIEAMTGASLADLAAPRRREVDIAIDAGACLPGQLWLFRAPASATGEDVAELHVPGSPPLLAMLVEEALRRGARPAGPGEFTQRAFLAGKLDLTQAEAVAEVIASRSDAELRAAARLLQGELAEKTAAMRERLSDLLAEVEASIDFGEEEIELISTAKLASVAGALAEEIDRLLGTSPRWEEFASLPRVALAGRPNAGKSSLMNRLTGLDRSIISSVPGTTRDVLTAPLLLEGGEVILQDAAGLLDPPADAIGIEAATAARRALEQADLACLVIDAAAGVRPGDLDLLHAARGPGLVLLNKADLCSEERLAELTAEVRSRRTEPVLVCSARTGRGLAALRRQLAQHVRGPRGSTGGGVALNARHRENLHAARAALLRAVSLAGPARTPPHELVALELREALDRLGEIAGRTLAEDLLGRIFSRFCIGK